MDERLLLDTDVLIDYLRGVPEAVSYLEAQDGPLYTSAITAAELYAGVREGKERAELDTFLSAFDVLPVNAALAERGGLYCRDYRPSHGTELTDALIAATVKSLDAVLVTLNEKHYPMLPDRIRVPYRKMSR